MLIGAAHSRSSLHHDLRLRSMRHTSDIAFFFTVRFFMFTFLLCAFYSFFVLLQQQKAQRTLAHKNTLKTTQHSVMKMTDILVARLLR
jgi:type VI protein secretion system component VasF